ncbi:DUF3846 domain-containing protein [Lacrimispora saccharolytica]|uniref:DUF3846 domain-containing protein n=1 Tax=Lacrimispora saccharolytica (strain ATCC 35040 / DSM 2544 / NRCC 2533 / WM1) TaxID=610130 RepID=D9R6E1_LACSW|nr:DUF3846 domain-containing protein [Lacrimispora saccharolytica]ADL05351.1 conserved hypothetical protein [[Clostridium] saccharolyticum WM1]QRV20481.1 DUF3846 domain-containing protein [Lacrimispora saccharolytica]
MKDDNKIRVLKIEPGKMPYEKEMVNDLEGIQAEVGGFFECVYLEDGCIAVVNEEGKLNGMELNRRIGNDIIAGPFFICGDSEDGEFVSLTDVECEKYMGEFKGIPEFSGDEPEAQPRMTFISFKY